MRRTVRVLTLLSEGFHTTFLGALVLIVVVIL